MSTVGKGQWGKHLRPNETEQQFDERRRQKKLIYAHLWATCQGDGVANLNDLAGQIAALGYTIEDVVRWQLPSGTRAREIRRMVFRLGQKEWG